MFDITVSSDEMICVFEFELLFELSILNPLRLFVGLFGLCFIISGLKISYTNQDDAPNRCNVESLVLVVVVVRDDV